VLLLAVRHRGVEEQRRVLSACNVSVSGELKLHDSVSAGPAGTGAVDDRVSRDGKTPLVNGSAANVVASVAISGSATLTELPSSPTPLPVGAHASGIVVN
jgi:hypothetical protein